MQSQESINKIELPVKIELGKVWLSLDELRLYNKGSIINTKFNYTDRVTLSIAGNKIAFGRLVDLDNTLAVEIDEILLK